MRGTRWGWTNIRFPPSCQSIATAVASAPVPAVLGTATTGGPGTMSAVAAGRRSGPVGWRARRSELGGVEGAAAADARPPRPIARRRAQRADGAGSAPHHSRATHTANPASSIDACVRACRPRAATTLSTTSRTAAPPRDAEGPQLTGARRTRRVPRAAGWARRRGAADDRYGVWRSFRWGRRGRERLSGVPGVRGRGRGEASQRGAQSCGDGGRPAFLPADIHVHEVAGRCRLVASVGEEPDLVPDARRDRRGRPVRAPR